MTNVINAGILGTGHAHAVGKLRTIQASPDYKLVGICEPDKDLRNSRQNGSLSRQASGGKAFCSVLHLVVSAITNIRDKKASKGIAG